MGIKETFFVSNLLFSDLSFKMFRADNRCWNNRKKLYQMKSAKMILNFTYRNVIWENEELNKEATLKGI